MMKSKNIWFIVAEDWNFCTHRFNLGEELVRRGHQVTLVTRISQHRDKIEQAGISVVEHDFNRGSLSQVSVLISVWRLICLFRAARPDVVHAVALQPILCASIAARFVSIPRFVSAFGGLGYLFASTTLKSRVIRFALLKILRCTLYKNSTRQIVQNPENRQILLDHHICPEDQITMIPGAGVNLSDYRQTSHNVGIPKVAMLARLLKDKGVVEFIDAAQLLKERGIQAEFMLVGDIDTQNPASLTAEEVDTFSQTDNIDFLGWQNDIPDILAKTQIVCLPSYHEGFPKALLEAAASHCAIVASDIAGCRALITHNETGLLAKVKSVDDLADQLEKVIVSKELREKLSQAAYAHICAHNTDEIVIQKTIETYFDGA